MLTVEKATELILGLPKWKQSMVILLLGRWELAITKGDKDFYMPKADGGSDADLLACLLASSPIKNNWEEIRAKL